MRSFPRGFRRKNADQNIGFDMFVPSEVMWGADRTIPKYMNPLTVLDVRL